MAVHKCRCIYLRLSMALRRCWCGCAVDRRRLKSWLVRMTWHCCSVPVPAGVLCTTCRGVRVPPRCWWHCHVTASRRMSFSTSTVRLLDHYHHYIHAGNCSVLPASNTVLMLLAGSISDQPHSKWWWCHDIGYLLLAAEHSPCKAPWSGTRCRMTSLHSRTVSPLDSTWKPGFFLATSVLSALETLWQLCSINSNWPYHTIPYHTL